MSYWSALWVIITNSSSFSLDKCIEDNIDLVSGIQVKIDTSQDRHKSR